MEKKKSELMIIFYILEETAKCHVRMVWLFSLHELKKEEMGVLGGLSMKQEGSEPMQEL